MSAWGPGLYQSDVTADLKSLFAELVQIPYDAGRLIEIAAASFEASRSDDYPAKAYAPINGLLTDFKTPQMRWFFRLSLSLNKIVDRRGEGEEAKPLSLGFAVEHESPLRRGPLERTVPSGTRIVLTANFDVLARLGRAAPKK